MRSSEPSILPWAVCILRNENVDLKSPWQTFSNLSMLVVATIHRLQVSRSSCCGLVWIGLSVSGGHGLSFREPLVYTALHENIKLFQYAKILLKCKGKLGVFFLFCLMRYCYRQARRVWRPEETGNWTTDSVVNNCWQLKFNQCQPSQLGQASKFVNKSDTMLQYAT